MTIASEITRLQGAKSDIRQAIIDKGVDVGAGLTIDQYAACIAEISTGPKTGYIDLLVVGGGGAGGNCSNYRCGGAGGGAGGLIYHCGLPISQEILCYSVVVGKGGVYKGENQLCGQGCNSSFGEYIAYGGGYGASCRSNWYAGSGGSGGGGFTRGAGAGCCGQGNNGGNGEYVDGQKFGGGGGAGSPGGTAGGEAKGGNGGIGKQYNINGKNCYYAGGGGGGSTNYTPGTSGCGANYCGGGGHGVTGCPGYSESDFDGKQGVVILRYHTNGSDGLLPTSYGGCRYNCGVYTIHCFTNTSATETFTPVFK